MGFRFRKSLKLGRGVKLNISHRGVSSLSVGRRGATVSAGKRGLRSTVSIPGTGLSYTTETGGRKKKSRSGKGTGASPEATPLAVVIVLFILVLFLALIIW